MQRIVRILLYRRNTFLYLLLLAVSLMLTVQTHSYHQAKFFNSSNWFTGKVYEVSSGITNFYGLKEENRLLIAENKTLRAMTFNTTDSIPELQDSVLLQFSFRSARVVKNSYASSKNYITIDKGSKDSVSQDMGVITPDGLLGIVESTSKNYATVQTVLNTKSSLNAKLKGTEYFGSLIWNAKRHDAIQLVEIPRLAPLVVGDTIVTGGMSSIFPREIPIGVVKKYSLNDSKSAYNIDVQPFTDMTNIKVVYVIKNKNREEITELEARTENVE